MEALAATTQRNIDRGELDASLDKYKPATSLLTVMLVAPIALAAEGAVGEVRWVKEHSSWLIYLLGRLPPVLQPYSEAVGLGAGAKLLQRQYFLRAGFGMSNPLFLLSRGCTTAYLAALQESCL